MVGDAAAAERMVDRLAAVKFDHEVAFARQSSRGRLVREFLRRTALWARELGAESGWPYSDLAGALEPEVDVEPHQLARLEIDADTSDEFPIGPKLGALIVRWAALGDLPRQSFPHLDDPYEPLLVLFDRGGGCRKLGGWIEMGYGEFPVGTLEDRALYEPRPIDQAALDACDAKPSEPSSAEVAEGQALMAAWWNARINESEPRLTAESFAAWTVTYWDDFLAFWHPIPRELSDPILVGQGVVRPVDRSRETLNAALVSARAERDGLITPEPPEPSATPLTAWLKGEQI